MTELAIQRQLEALEKTRKKALESKEASLQFLIKLRLIPSKVASVRTSGTNASVKAR